jgi:galactosylceramidase
MTRKPNAVAAELYIALAAAVALYTPVAKGDQTVELKGEAAGKRFDGVGAVSGGGATSVLLKDYPEPQRSQVLDLLFKPKFGASMPSLFVEVPGDGNSTQGTEPSHMHTRTDENYYRGYEWWLMAEAKKHNPDITVDACAWSAPAWVGNGQFWSQDMADYYVKWIKGLKAEHGVELDAIGCRNEKGFNADFAKKLRASLNAAGLQNVRLHGFDNWGATKFDFVRAMETDVAFRDAVDIISAHTMSEVPASDAVKQFAEKYDKPLWNTEEHIYKQGFDCEISLVQAYNDNFIKSGQTKIINWYLAAALYPVEPYPETPASLVANSPWSGHYQPREVLWGYAHYGQFVKVGWRYVNGGCVGLSGGGSIVTMKAPDAGTDYSIIAETKAAKTPQTLTFKVGAGLADTKLCVWRSNAAEQFVRLADITPVDGTFSVTLEPAALYSLSTTTGQQKGSFADVPAAKPFPFPYYENFEAYTAPKQWGYLPHYFADIVGVFEVTDRPDGAGKCLRQVVDQKAQSWAPEWSPFTILGDAAWKDYEVSTDMYLDNGGWAGVMGRISNVGGGYGTNPKGYFLRLASDGTWGLFAPNQQQRNPDGAELKAGKVENVAQKQWHNLKLQFAGRTIKALIDGNEVASVTDATHAAGLAGLVTGGTGNARNSALFDDVIINEVGGQKPAPTQFPASVWPIYNK